MDIIYEDDGFQIIRGNQYLQCRHNCRKDIENNPLYAYRNYEDEGKMGCGICGELASQEFVKIWDMMYKLQARFKICI